MKLEYASEEYFVVLPPEVVNKWNLAEGDEVEWVIEEDKIYLRKNNS